VLLVHGAELCTAVDCAKLAPGLRRPVFFPSEYVFISTTVLMSIVLITSLHAAALTLQWTANRRSAPWCWGRFSVSDENLVACHNPASPWSCSMSPLVLRGCGGLAVVLAVGQIILFPCSTALNQHSVDAPALLPPC
jgi:hypothetical protein